MILNKNFPNFLRDLNFSFMPVYCRRTRHLYLVDETLWNSIFHKVSYRRARRFVPVRYIKIFNFVYPFENSPWRFLTPQHILFLRNKHLLVPNLKVNPRLSTYGLTAIDSCYFVRHFQRMFSEVHKHWIWVSFIKGKYCRRRIRLGYYTEYSCRPVDFDS